MIKRKCENLLFLKIFLIIKLNFETEVKGNYHFIPLHKFIGYFFLVYFKSNNGAANFINPH